MSTTSSTQETAHQGQGPELRTPYRGIARNLVLRSLRSIESGILQIREGSNVISLGKPAEDGLEATIDVLDPRFYRGTLLRGSVGAAEAYVAGWWKTEDLTAVVRVLARNLDSVDSMDSGLQWLISMINSVAYG